MKVKTFKNRNRKKRLKKRVPQKGFLGKILGFPWKIIILIGGVSVVALLTIYSVFGLPSVKGADQLSFSQSTIIYDRGALDPESDPNEHILYTIHGDENREYIPLEDMSPWLGKATLAIEDDGFYRHQGFDIGGLFKAVLSEIGIGTARGGSTITQQLVKNTFLSNERTYTRKLNELLLSLKVEGEYSKDEILELYLNKIPYDATAHGAEAAAKKFFDKSARDLTLAEASILASLPVAPTRFSPYGSNLDLLLGYDEIDEETGEKTYKKGRKDLVLERMLDLKLITFEEFETAFEEAKTIEFSGAKSDIKAPHFVFYVREQLENKFGTDFLKDGGLRIYTTLDPELQTKAEEIIGGQTDHYANTYGAKNAAMVSIDQTNGQILAYVGGRDYFDTENDGQVDVLTSYRQPGSSYKPFAYASAFDRGYGPGTVVFDVDTDFGGNYRPQNFDGTFQGPVSLRDSLNSSLNIPAVKATYLADPFNVMNLAAKAGIDQQGTPSDHGVALGIGVSEVQPLSHISAYQVFANDGAYFEPSSILEVQDANGKVLESFDIEKQRKEGINPGSAALVRNILTDETSRPTTDGFDWNRLLQIPGVDNGVKTGTSNRITRNPKYDENISVDEETNPLTVTLPGDSWTVGFSPHLITGVWVGNNTGEAMRSGATGLTVAAPLWRNFMIFAHEKIFENGADPEKTYPSSAPLQKQLINKLSGKLATEETPESLKVEEVFATGTNPPTLDNSVQEIEINRITGQPADETTPENLKIKQKVLQLSSIEPGIPNWNNPVREWIFNHPRFMLSMGTIFDEGPLEEPIESETPETNPEDLARLLKDPSSEGLGEFGSPPMIDITSPREGGTIAPGSIDVQVSTSSRFGIKNVEFYLNDKYEMTSTQWPYTGNIVLPVESPETNYIKVIIMDERGAISFDEVKITLGEDTTGPSIAFLGPIGNQLIPVNADIQILADVIDYESGIKSVEFFYEGAVISTKTNAPYSTFFNVGPEMGRKQITVKATDIHGNISEKTIPVSITRGSIINSSEPSIDKVINYRNSVSVDVIVPNIEQYEWIKFVAEQGQEIIITETREPQTYLQFQIAKNLRGRTRVRVYAKLNGSEEIIETPIKFIEL